MACSSVHWWLLCETTSSVKNTGGKHIATSEDFQGWSNFDVMQIELQNACDAPAWMCHHAAMEDSFELTTSVCFFLQTILFSMSVATETNVVGWHANILDWQEFVDFGGDMRLVENGAFKEHMNFKTQEFKVTRLWWGQQTMTGVLKSDWKNQIIKRGDLGKSINVKEQNPFDVMFMWSPSAFLHVWAHWTILKWQQLWWFHHQILMNVFASFHLTLFSSHKKLWCTQKTMVCHLKTNWTKTKN